MKKVKTSATTPAAGRGSASVVMTPSSTVASSVPNRELLHRINFLHQAAVLLANATHNKTANPRKRKRHSRRPRNDDQNNVADAALVATQPETGSVAASGAPRTRLALELQSLLDDARQDFEAKRPPFITLGYAGPEYPWLSQQDKSNYVYNAEQNDQFLIPVATGELTPPELTSPQPELAGHRSPQPDTVPQHGVPDEAVEQPQAVSAEFTPPVFGPHVDLAAAKRQRRPSSRRQNRASVGMVFPHKDHLEAGIAELTTAARTKQKSAAPAVQPGDYDGTAADGQTLSFSAQLLCVARSCLNELPSMPREHPEQRAVSQILSAYFLLDDDEAAAARTTVKADALDLMHPRLTRGQRKVLYEFIETSGQAHRLPAWPSEREPRDDPVVSRAGRKAQKRQAAASARQQLAMRSTLPSVYGSDVRAIARKAVLRLDPSVKRHFCRNCNTVLIPGVTSSIRIKPSAAHVHLTRIKCLACGQTRTLPSPPIQAAAAHTSAPGSAGLDDCMETGVTSARSPEAVPAPEAAATASSSLVAPGSSRQHVQPRFHERSVHNVTIGNARL